MMSEYEGYWLKKGTVLNKKYEILDVIDEGGMGIVYLGYDKVLQQQVSIKEFFPRRFAMRMSGEKKVVVYKGRSGELFSIGLEKFINEARILARFDSLDSIVMVKDFFYENQTAYMVMERIKGQNVKQFVESQGPMEPEHVLAIMKPILYSVGEIHKEGLLHRDISPDNIVLTPDNKGVLIDFGAARFLETQDNKTMTVFFKRGYSAEEQYVEKSHKGAYTDVYGACATMYFMLTGIRPDESVKRLIRDQVVPLWRFKDIGLKRYKEQVIMRGMAVDAKKRYSSMDELCAALYSNGKSTGKWVKYGGIVCLLAACAATAIAQCSFFEKEDTTTEKSSSARVIATTKPVNKTYAPSPIPTRQTYRMCNVIGLKQSKAIKKLHTLNANLKIKVRWKISSKKNKGKVVSQKIHSKKVLFCDQSYTQVLTIGKGPKRKIVVKTTPKPTTKPVKKKEHDKFDGRLPW